MLEKVDFQGKHPMALDADVVPSPTHGWPLPFALTPKARQAGAVTLKVDAVHTTGVQMNQLLAESIYKGQTPDDLIP